MFSALLLHRLWLRLFGVTALWGVDMGFWVGIAAVVLIVAVQNLFFWRRKAPKKN